MFWILQMAPLALLLLLKIAITLLVVSGPFLVLPKSKIDQLSGYAGTPVAFYRLYGTAIFALLVAYSGGLVSVLSGNVPWTVIAMGIASNLGATLVMIGTGEARKHPALAAFFAFIAAGLVGAALLPEMAVTPLKL